MLKKKNRRRRKKEKKKEGEKERERVFKEVMCGKVVGPFLSKGNNIKNVKKYYFNKRGVYYR